MATIAEDFSFEIWKVSNWGLSFFIYLFEMGRLGLRRKLQFFSHSDYKSG